MSRDIKDLKKSLKKYEIGKILDKTQKVMDLLSQKVLAKDSILIQYKKFAKTIQKNIKRLKQNSKNFKTNDKSIMKFIRANFKVSVNDMSKSLNNALVVMGIFILAVLIVIYVKLGKKRNEIL